VSAHVQQAAEQNIACKSLQGIFEIWLNFSEFFDISLFSFEIILHFAFAAGN